MVKNKNMIHIIGAGAQGLVWAQNLSEQKVRVRVYLRKPAKVRSKVSGPVYPLSELRGHLEAETAKPIVAMLIPDESHMDVIRQYLPLDRAMYLVFAHGYTPTYEKLPKTLEPILCAPKVIGVRLRERFLNKQAVPIAVHGKTPEGLRIAKQLALLIGASKRTLLPMSWQMETEADLFSEQVLLCGGLPMMVESAFRLLVEKGIPEKAAWAEIMFELDMLQSLYLRKGFADVLKQVSAKAAYGTTTFAKAHRKSIDQRHREVWKSIQSKTFHKQSSRYTPSEIRKLVQKLLEGKPHGTPMVDDFYRRNRKWIEEVIS